MEPRPSAAVDFEQLAERLRQVFSDDAIATPVGALDLSVGEPAPGVLANRWQSANPVVARGWTWRCPDPATFDRLVSALA